MRAGRGRGRRRAPAADTDPRTAQVLPEDANATERADSAAEGAEDEGLAARAVLRGVRPSCPRTPQCAPNPCRSGGACEDAWTSFVCTCPRPHLGGTCQYNYTAATFGHEAARARAVVRVAVDERARRAVRAALDISMFIRTRKPTGQIFYLGSLPRCAATLHTLSLTLLSLDRPNIF